MKKVLFFIIVILALTISGCQTQEIEEATPEVTALAQCMTDNGVVVFSSITCSHCVRQKALFGTAFENIEEVECHPDGENAQPEYCLEKDIPGTPTWIREDEEGNEIDRIVGTQTLEALAEFSDCPYEVE